MAGDLPPRTGRALAGSLPNDDIADATLITDLLRHKTPLDPYSDKGMHRVESRPRLSTLPLKSTYGGHAMRRFLVPAALAIAALGLTAPPAAAAFPGSNGRLAYDNGLHIFTVTPGGADRTKLSDERDVESAFSPDGSRLAFSHLVDDGTGLLYGDIWVMDADGSHRVPVTSGPADDRGPAWTSDGSRIVFTRNPDPNGFGVNDIWIADADGSPQAALTNTRASEVDPEPSPLGDRIVYTRGGDIWTMAANGRDRSPLVTSDVNEYNPSWSPSGGRIVYQACPAGPDFSATCEIYSVKSDGGGRLRLTNNDLFDGEPAYSPDGQRIAFAASRPRKQVPSLTKEGILTMGRFGGDERRVTGTFGYAHGNPSWQPR